MSEKPHGSLTRTPNASQFLRRTVACAAMVISVFASSAAAQSAGPNVNMVSGTKLPEGDPFLQRQNEPSIAVSTRNACHLLAGANDYRTVDMPGLPDDKENGDAWLGLFKSFDCGKTWRSTLLPGFPQDASAAGTASPLKGLAAGADPMVRAGTHGLFYYGGMAFNRGNQGASKAFVARFIDTNVSEKEPDPNGPQSGNPKGQKYQQRDPIQYLGTSVIDAGTSGQFVDKPSIATDIPRAGAPVCRIPDPSQLAGPGYSVPAGTVYAVHTIFVGRLANSTTKLVVTRSTDCGATWEKSIKISEGIKTNQGAAIAVAPNGTVYIAWRQFASAGQSNAILVSRSTDGGATFTKGSSIAQVSPFDQNTSTASFRTSAYPTIAIDGSNRVYVAWSARGFARPWLDAVAGDARVVVSTSKDGAPWTAPVAADDQAGVRGHQIMPALTVAAGRLQLIYYDLRDDHSYLRYLKQSDGSYQFPGSRVPAGDLATDPPGTDKVFTPSIADVAPGGGPLRRRHTIDVRGAQAVPADKPQFTSWPISQYAFGVFGYQGPEYQEPDRIEQLEFNPPNLPLYAKGTAPFLGDYIDVAGQSFIAGPKNTWTFNTDAIGPDGKPVPAVFHAVWTDNRDVRPPALGKTWANYTPPTFTQEGWPQPPVCDPGTTGMRNANIYTSRIAPPLVLSSPDNAKSLDRKLPSAFPIVVTNGETTDKYYRLQIPNQPPGAGTDGPGFASFVEALPPLPAVVRLDIKIPPGSSAARMVFVRSGQTDAQVAVTIQEVDSAGTIVENGTQGSLTLNSDQTNPAITNPAITNPAITNQTFNPAITNPAITNPAITNPAITNPAITNPAITNPAITNPAITNPAITNPAITNPAITNPAITNPAITNPAITNGAITDVTWTVTNNGTASGAFTTKMLMKQPLPSGLITQLVVHKSYVTPVALPNSCEIGQSNQDMIIANILNPAITNPAITNPAITNPAITNPAITNPAITNPAITNPAITNPAITNPAITNTALDDATFALAPGETVKVTLRIVTPLADTQTVQVNNPGTDEPTTVTVPVGLVEPADIGGISALAVTPTAVSQALNVEAATLQQQPPAAASLDTLLFVQEPTATKAGVAIAPAIQVRALGAGGVISGSPVTLSLVLPDGATGALGGILTATTDASGTATFADVRVLEAGTGNRLRATVTSPSELTATSLLFDIQLVAVLPSAFLSRSTNVNQGLVLSDLLAAQPNPNGDVLTITGASLGLPAHGTVTFTSSMVVYTPGANYSGTDTLYYVVRDTYGQSATSVVYITVNAVNHAPTFVIGANQTVVKNAGPQTVQNWATNISAGSPDEAGQSLTFVVTTNQPALFSVQPAVGPSGTLTYTPSSTGVGTATLTVILSDSGGTLNGGVDTSVPQMFTISVQAGNNAPPAAVNDTATTAEDVAVTISVLANDTDVNRDTLTVIGVSSAAHGTATIATGGTAVVYQPAANYNGSDTFTYTVSDGKGGTAIGTVTVTVTPVNDPPVATPQSVTAPAATPTAIMLAGADVDGGALTFAVATPPAHGSLTGASPNFIYTSASNYAGTTDSFTFTAFDGLATSAPATVSIAIHAVNHAPVANADVASVLAGRSVAIDVLANDVDADGSRTGLSLIASVPFNLPGLPQNLQMVTETAVVPTTVPGTGRLYAYTGRGIAVYKLSDTTLETLIPLQGQGSARLHGVDASAGIVYFLHSNAITAVDARSGPTYNQILATITFGSGVSSIAVDETLHRVYIAHGTNAGGAQAWPQLAVIDGNRLNPTFLTVVATGPLQYYGNGIAFNAATNTVYVASNSTPGLTAVTYNGTTFAATPIAGTSPCYDVVVDPANGMVYGLGTSSGPTGTVVAVDPTNGNAVTSISLTNWPGTINWPGKMIRVNTVTHRVYVVGAGTTMVSGRLAVIDGAREISPGVPNPNFRTLLTTIATERDYVDLVIDETHNRVVTTGEAGTLVIDGGTNTIVGTVRANQATYDIALNPAAGVAYVSTNGWGGFQVVSIIAEPPAESSLVLTATETGSVVVDPTNHRAYTAAVSGTASVLALTGNGVATPVTRLPTDRGRYMSKAGNRTTRKVYVANYAAGASGGLAFPGFVAVIDAASGTVTKVITVGDQPLGIGIDETNNRIYVANYGLSGTPGTISVIDGSTDTVLTTVTSPSSSVRFVRDLAPNTATNKVYLRSASSASPLWVLNGATFALSAVTLPSSTATVSIIRVNSEKNRVYVGMSNGQLYVLNGADNSIVAQLTVGYPSSMVGTQSYIAINDTTDEVYVADYLNRLVTVLDYNGAILGSVTVGDGPTALVINETLNRVYVGSSTDRMLMAIDGATRKVIAGISLPFPANFLAIDPGDSRIYGSSGSSATDIGLTVIADAIGGPTSTLRVATVAPAGQGSTGILGDRLAFYSALPTASGGDSFTYTATDGQATSNAATVTVTIATPLTITTSSLPNGRTGVAYAQTLGAAGGTGARTWLLSSGYLPVGTILDAATGTIRGTPTTAGLYGFTVRVQDSPVPPQVPQVATRALSIAVGPLVILTGSLPTGSVGQIYSQTLAAAPVTGTANWTLSSGSLPPGLILSPSGVISGAPLVNGRTSFTVAVTDSDVPGVVATRELTLFIGPLGIVDPPTPAVLFEGYSTALSGGNGQFQWTVTGTLPRGMSAGSSNGITGTPLESGSFPVTLSVTDCANNSCPTGVVAQTDTKSVTLRVLGIDQQISRDDTQSAITFGGPTATDRRLAQTITARATGGVAAVRFQWVSCPTAGTTLTAGVEGVDPGTGLPNGHVLATGRLTSSYTNAIRLSDDLPVAPGTRLAVTLSADKACSMQYVPVTDSYAAGAGFVNDGAGWQSMLTAVGTIGRPDVPTQTLILPAAGLVSTIKSHSGSDVAVRLNSGHVLYLSNSGTAEVYDPTTRTFASVASTFTGTSNSRRNSFTATLLTSSNKVLIAGGVQSNVYLNTLEVFTPGSPNPAAGTFSTVAPGPFNARSQHTATLLPGGKVLMAGGVNTGQQSRVIPTEVCDDTGCTADGSVLLGRFEHTATLLQNGKVLLAGGYTASPGTPMAEIYTPGSGGSLGSSAPTTNTMSYSRAQHTATLLTCPPGPACSYGGKVLLAGGVDGVGLPVADAELYDPGTSNFTAAGTMAVARLNHTATRLPDGSVLIAGGTNSRYPDPTIPFASLERYVPGASPAFVSAGNLLVARNDQIAETMTDDSVFIGGGTSGGNGSALASRTIEFYDPAQAATRLVITPAVLSDGQAGSPYPGATIQTAGGTGPYTYSVISGALPGPLALSSAGVIAGGAVLAAGTQGSWTFVVRVADSASPTPHVATQNLTVRVNPLVVTTAADLPLAYQNEPYSVQLQATGWGQLTWMQAPNSGSVPSNLSLSNSGVLSGTPTVGTGWWSFLVRVQDALGQVAYQSLRVPVVQRLRISATPWPDAVLFNTLGSFNFTGGSGTKVWTLTGSVPPGVAFNTSTGGFTGTLTLPGDFTFTAQVTDCVSTPCSFGLPQQTDSRTMTVRVSATDQQPGTGSGTVGFGGAGSGAPRLAQTITAGAAGSLRALQFSSLSCPTGTQLTIGVEGIDPATGGPDGNPLASGTTTSSYPSPIRITPDVPVLPGSRFAVTLSANSACSLQNAQSTDSYTAGAGFVNTGSAWLPMAGGIADIPLSTLILPASGLAYTTRSHTFDDVAVRLQSGKVLYVTRDGTAEIYDPGERRFTSVASTFTGRGNFTATLLPSTGQVLIVGGSSGSPGNTTYYNQLVVFTPDLQDPLTGTFTTPGGGVSLVNARAMHSATLLECPPSNSSCSYGGNVLIAGGSNGSGPVLQTEVCSASGCAVDRSLLLGRSDHTATLLTCPAAAPNCAYGGKVLIAGGNNSNPPTMAEVYTPGVGSDWSVTLNTMSHVRTRHTATLLTCPTADPNCAYGGKVLIVGGYDATNLPTADADLFDPVTSTFTPAGSMSLTRQYHRAARLPDGSVLIAGGNSTPDGETTVVPLASMERWLPPVATPPAAARFVGAGSLLVARTRLAIETLADGPIFLGGGMFGTPVASKIVNWTAETYDPSSAASLLAITNAPLPDGHVGVSYPGATLLVTGGTGPYTFEVISGALPSPLTLSAGGVIGTDVLATLTQGQWTFAVRVTDSAVQPHVATQALTIRVDPLAVTTPVYLPAVYQGEPYSVQLQASGWGAKTWTFVSGSLPSGLAMSVDGSGLISGTTSSCCNYTITVRAQDSLGQVAFQTLQLFVVQRLAVTSTPAPDAVVNSGLGGLNWAGGAGTRAWSKTAGTLPTGVSLNANGGFDGMATAPGEFAFTVRVTDCMNGSCQAGWPQQTAFADLNIRVSDIDQQVQAFGGAPTVSFGVLGQTTRRLAQTITAGATGTMGAIQIWNLSCQTAGTLVTVGIEGVDPATGAPDGNSLATGTATSSYSSPIRLSAGIPALPGTRLAVTLAANNSCSIGNASAFDQYTVGAGFINEGAGWLPSASTVVAADLPLSTLILPDNGLLYSARPFSSSDVAVRLDATHVLHLTVGGTAEVYDSTARTFTTVAAPFTARNNFTATALPSGEVLIVGGDQNNTTYLKSVKLFTLGSTNLAAGTFSDVGSGLVHARAQHTATLLPSGNVLIAGGMDATHRVTQTEVCDASGCTEDGTLLLGRVEHTATLLTCPALEPGCAFDGKVLIAGGYPDGPGSPMAELYTPGGGTGSSVAAGAMSIMRAQHTATRLDDGTVLLAGGVGNWSTPAADADLFHPDTSLFTAAGTMAVPRLNHVAALAPGGTVILAGGTSNRWNEPTVPLATIERYVPGAVSPFVGAGSLLAARSDLVAAALGDGSLFFGGGMANGTASVLASRTAEIFAAGPGSVRLAITNTPLPDGKTGVLYPGVTLQASGGTGSYTFQHIAGALPAPLTFTNGFINSDVLDTGTQGQWTFTVQVADSASHVATQNLTIRVNPLAVRTSADLPAAYQNEYYSQQLEASGWGANTWTLVSGPGSLPTGVGLSSGGLISGTPTAGTGWWSFLVRVQDALGQAAFKELRLVVTSRLSITTPATFDAQLLQEFNQGLFFSGGTGLPTWSLALQQGERLPRGLSLISSGALPPSWNLQGSPSEAGTFAFTVLATDAGSPAQTQTRTFTLRVVAQDQWTGASGSTTVQFGTIGFARIAQTMTTGATGALAAVLPSPLSCPSGTVLTVEVRRLAATPPFAPDDSTDALASGTATWPSMWVSFATPPFLPAGARVAIVLGANGACTAQAYTSNESYGAGDPFVFDGSSWQSPIGFVEFGVNTYVLPSQGLTYPESSLYNPVATPLLDGRILVTSDATAQVYDPATTDPAIGQFTTTANNLHETRSFHAAVRLECPSGDGCGYHGKVLVTGGVRYNCPNPPVSSTTAELFDPVSRTFSSIVNPMGVSRARHTMTRLQDGRILIAGGETYDSGGISQYLKSAVIFDPANQSFTPTGDMLVRRGRHTATLLTCPTAEPNCAYDGKVLIVGGYVTCPGGGVPCPGAEIFDPASGGSFRATTGSPAGGLYQRAEHTATLLTNGNVLIAGGFGQHPNLDSTVEIYRVDHDDFVVAAGPLAVPRRAHAAVALADGRVLLAGGLDRWVGMPQALSSVEIFDPQAPTSSVSRSLLVARTDLQAVRLACPPALPGCAWENDIFVVGGVGGSGTGAVSPRSAEVLDLHSPAGTLALTTLALPNGQTGQAYPGATLAAVGGTSSYAFAIASGSLPPGIELDGATGALSSPQNITLTTPGAYQFVASVTDHTGAQAFQGLTIRVDPLTIAWGTSSLPSAVLGVPYLVRMSVIGTGPFVWSLEPAGEVVGLTLQSSGHWTGTPTQLGCWSVTVRVTDASYQTATESFNLCVNNALEITTTSLPDTAIGWGGWPCLTSQGGQGPTIHWSLSPESVQSLPDGVTLNDNGCFTGQAMTTGTFALKFRAADDDGQADTQDVTLGVFSADQYFGWFDPDLQKSLPISIGQPVAQIIRVGMTGELRDIQLPVACTSGNLTVAIHDVTGTGQPGPNALALWEVPGSSLPPFTSGAQPRMILLPAPLPFTVDSRFAVVLGATTGGACSIQQMPSKVNDWETYIDGEGYLLSGGDWMPLSGFDSTRPDLPFVTLVDPLGALVFAPEGTGGHTATLLASGKILLAGVHGPGAGASARLFNPTTNSYEPAAHQMIVPRYDHTATMLSSTPGTGFVLIVGGRAKSDGHVLDSAEIYSPVLETFTEVGPLATARTQHEATLLDDGRVLITGGFSSTGQMLQSAELYNPIVNPGDSAFSAAGSMLTARGVHAAVCLIDGSVLITGGLAGTVNSAERYLPAAGAAGTFTVTGNMVQPRSSHAAVLLLNGTVLVVGGERSDGPGMAAAAEVYDPAGALGAGTFSSAGVGALNVPRRVLTATRLDDGRVAVVGGEVSVPLGSGSLTAREIYDPVARTFSADGETVVARSWHTATLLGDGRVFLHGGYGRSTTSNSGEFYSPGGTGTLGFDTVSLPDGHANSFYNSGPIAVHGNTGSYGFQIVSSALPQGLGLSCVMSCTGPTSITGTTTSPGTYQFMLHVSDSAGHLALRTFTLRIDALQITTTSLPEATAGATYPVTLAATGGTGLTWSVTSGFLPPGLALSGTGTFNNTVSSGVNGGYSFTVRVRSGDGQVAYQSLFIWVDPPMQITTTSLPDTTVQWEWDNWPCLSQQYGHDTVHWTPVSGSVLPRGLTLNDSGCFNGQPLETGTFSFVVQAQDTSPHPQTLNSSTLSLQVNATDQDYGGGRIDPLNAWPLYSQRQAAQVVRAGITGQLRALLLPVACLGGNLTVEIRDVTGTGAPGSVVLGSTTIPGTDLPPFTGGAQHRTIRLSSPISFQVDAQYAIVLGSTGSCTVRGMLELTNLAEMYRDGAGYQLVRSLITDPWVATAFEDLTPTRPNLPFATLVDPENRLVFSQDFRAGHTATLITQAGSADLNKVLLAGGTSWQGASQARVYNPSTSVFAATTVQMVTPRTGHTATTLADGRILIVGGAVRPTMSYSRVPRSTIRARVSSSLREASAPPGRNTQRRCCRAARCSSRAACRRPTSSCKVRRSTTPKAGHSRSLRVRCWHLDSTIQPRC